MEFTIRHPDDPTWLATYGHDPERSGPWAELEYCDVPVSYDAAEIDFDRDEPVRSVLTFLCEFDFLRGDDVDAALENCHDDNFRARAKGWPCRPV